jgi:hypothetical protein
MVWTILFLWQIKEGDYPSKINGGIRMSLGLGSRFIVVDSLFCGSASFL